MQVRRSATGSLPKGWRAARLARAGSCSHTPRSSFEMPLDEFTPSATRCPRGITSWGVTLAAGGALSWWRDVVHAGDYEDLGQLAGGVPPGSEGLVFLPYLSGERSPHLDPLARGPFFGLSSRHGAAHLTRAVMEGVAFSLRDSFEIMAGLGVAIAEIRVTGGGAKSALWPHN